MVNRREVGLLSFIALFSRLGEGGVQSTLLCIFNHCYFILSPNKLTFCHTIKQLYTQYHAKHGNNALQKQFTIN